VYNNDVIDKVQQVTVLGVCNDSQLDFTDHVVNLAVKGHQMANLILKCFKSRDSSCLVQAFVTYVPLHEILFW